MEDLTNYNTGVAYFFFLYYLFKYLFTYSYIFNEKLC